MLAVLLDSAEAVLAVRPGQIDLDLGVVGPYPAGAETDEQRDEYDRLRRRVLWTMPSGLYVAGSRHGERRNAMTLNWLMRA